MPNQDPPPLVEIASAANPIDAHILRAQLEDAGIECVLYGDILMNTVGLPYTGMNNLVRVLVREEDAEKAVAIVQPPDVDLLDS